MNKQKKSVKNSVVAVWTVIVMLIVAGVYLACENNPSTPNTGNTDPNVDKEMLALDSMLAALAEEAFQGRDGAMIYEDDEARGSGLGGKQTYAGYSINVFKGPTFADAIGSQFVTDDFLTTKDIDVIKMPQAQSDFSTSTTLSEVYSKLNVSASVETGKRVPFFSGGVSTQFGKEQTLKSTAIFFNYMYSYVLEKHTIDAIYEFDALMPDIMDPKKVALINNEKITPEQLFSSFGTHIIFSCFIGGSVNISALYNSDESATEQDVSVALNFSSSWVKGTAATNLSQKQKDIATSTSIKTTVKGGDVDKFGNVTSIQRVDEAVTKWAASINNNLSTLAGIDQAVPIWTLATNKTRRDAIEKAFYDKASKEINYLDNFFKQGARPLIENGGVYVIENFLHQTYVIDCGGKNDNEILYLYPRHSQKAQQWKAVAANAAPGYFYFEHQHSGKYMNVYGNKVDGHLMLFPLTAANNMLFKVADAGSGAVYIHSRMNDAYKLSGTDKGVGVKFYLRNNSNNETKWILHKVN